jgi:hypothetical protein
VSRAAVVASARGLRHRYRLAEEETDEEITEKDLGSDDLLALPAETWSVIRGCAEQLIIAAETDGLAGALAWLAARRLEWVWAGPDRHGMGQRGPSWPNSLGPLGPSWGHLGTVLT